MTAGHDCTNYLLLLQWFVAATAPAPALALALADADAEVLMLILMLPVLPACPVCLSLHSLPTNQGRPSCSYSLLAIHTTTYRYRAAASCICPCLGL